MPVSVWIIRRRIKILNNPKYVKICQFMGLTDIYEENIHSIWRETPKAIDE